MISGINEINISKEIVEEKKNKLEQEKKNRIDNLEKSISILNSKLGNFIDEDGNRYLNFYWLGKRFIYIEELKIIIPNLDDFPNFEMSLKSDFSKFSKKIDEKLKINLPESYQWELLTQADVSYLISPTNKFDNSDGNVFFINNKPVNTILVRKDFVHNSHIKNTKNSVFRLAALAAVTQSIEASPNTYKKNDESLYNIHKYDTSKKEIVSNVYGNKGDILPAIYFPNKLKAAEFFKNNKVESLGEIAKQKAKVLKELGEAKKETKLTFSNEQIFSFLLREDLERANIQEYSQNILTDSNKGYWDLDKDETKGNKTKIKLKESIYSRDSRLDIKSGGVIAIDFGTKSTVVMQEDSSNQIYPLRVGSGNYSKGIEESDYENPTVMEFIDIKSFINKYDKEQSRPDTKWKDLTVSHTAHERIFESSSKDYRSIFGQLKQWCGEKDTRIRIRDKNGYEFDLNNFLEIKSKDINPIELYAYYIGLYINNMRNGVYLEYFLSFPVTYSLEVKEKIRESFEKGIKKSLPVGVLSDDETMKSFRVEQGSSEPAAYAVTALSEYGFEPEDDERVFYGIFDFGGGTTDFDFGVWREADFDDIEEERYDYVIEHFGASGDRYLGGENLLELLAFEVFKFNKDKLLKENIGFRKPAEGRVFPGSENLISDSQEASLNTKKLMEELRPLWENHDGWEDKFSNGEILINLHTQSGDQKTNFELDIDADQLQLILKERIEKGVISFFESLKNVFHKQNLPDIEEINVFLGGNSSKSKILREIFDKYAKEISQDMKKEDVFKIFDPLKGGIDSGNEYKPNGKTGVAYGIIKTKAGGKIKVIDKNTNDNLEDRFNYYIGKVRKNRLMPIITPDCESAWVRYFAATEKDFEFYYTTDPRATTKKLPVSESKKIRATIDTIDTDANIYFKKSGLNILDIVVATEQGIKEDEYIETVGKFILD